MDKTKNLGLSAWIPDGNMAPYFGLSRAGGINRMHQKHSFRHFLGALIYAWNNFIEYL